MADVESVRLEGVDAAACRVWAGWWGGGRGSHHVGASEKVDGRCGECSPGPGTPPPAGCGQVCARDQVFAPQRWD
eukprot:363680-Chlamydomonas_euryale.AAC.3